MSDQIRFVRRANGVQVILENEEFEASIFMSYSAAAAFGQSLIRTAGGKEAILEREEQILIGMSPDVIPKQELTHVESLSALFKEDPDYARTWHDNLAMSFFDAMPEERGDERRNIVVANDGATRFMKLAFGVETKQNKVDDAH